MQTEREYRIACINKHFPSLKGRKVVVYGTGINAKLILDHASRYLDIIGLMDESQTGRILYGFNVLTYEEVVAACPDTLIIAAKIDSAIEVYKRIDVFCNDNGIDIYDLYGNNIESVRESIIEIEPEVDKETNEVIKERIDSSEVVSIDLKAMFKYSRKESEIIREVWENRFTRGTKAFLRLYGMISNQQEKSYGNLDSIYSMLKLYLCLSDEDKNDLLGAELILRRREIKINNYLSWLYRYALDHDKKIVLINESILPQHFWNFVLEDNGISIDSVVVLNRSEIAHNKYNGLYREIFAYEPNRSYLHIGSDYNADGIAAAVYGIKSIVITKEHENILVINEDEEGTDFLWNYCTDKIKYAAVECRYSGYYKLNVNDKYYAIFSKDTEISPGWLEQLVSTADKNQVASVICSRVKKKDGTIIYAGEKVKEDFAIQQNQMVSGFLPLYDYVRKASQISFFSFLVYKNKWDEAEKVVSGLRNVFQTYINSYEEVLYQPLSEVTYTDEKTNVDSMILNVDIKSKLKILVTDNLLTRFDRDAGSRCTWFYMNQFLKFGFDVTLMAQNFEEVQPYVMLIQQAGIRVIYGNYYRTHWKNWLAAENDSFKYIYMQRPESTAFFLEEIKENCSSGKIFYFACDLHFLRLNREYKITGNPDTLRASEKSKEMEKALIETADVVHVVGSFEQEWLQRMYPEKKIRNIPLYIYEQNSEEQYVPYDASTRKDLLFVGSFGHPPNLDAVVWFAEHIFPNIVEHYPNIVWHVVGANPPIEVQKYQGRNLVLHGFISDDELKNLYHTCRLVVAPLRYGAGVKGKLLEASYYRIPVVTTPIGAEGIPQGEHNMIVCNADKEFAEVVCQLYNDKEKLHVMSDGGGRLIKKYYSETAVKDVLQLDMSELQVR